MKLMLFYENIFYNFNPLFLCGVRRICDPTSHKIS